jgi:hypothetical protein
LKVRFKTGNKKYLASAAAAQSLLARPRFGYPARAYLLVLPMPKRPNLTLPLVNRWLVLAAVILFTGTAIKNAPGVWRGPPQMLAALDPETRDWVQHLKNKIGGPCCDTADGFPVEVDGWDMAGTVDDTSEMGEWQAGNARSGYRVRLADGKWHDVPNFALIDPKTNKLGYAVVWLRPPGTFHIYCFLPGSGG